MATGDPYQKSKQLEALQEHLEQFIENLRVVGVIAGDFQQNGQTVLNERLNSVVENMRLLDRMKEEYSNVQIPLPVLDYIDKGQNPELFTRHQLEQTVADHQAVQKKVEAYKEFRGQLIHHLQKAFPSEIRAYQTNYQQNSGRFMAAEFNKTVTE